jgi:ribosome-associated heat shock protein Hsp15
LVWEKKTAIEIGIVRLNFLLTLESKIRIDKYLWAVRLFKTRSLASEACEKGKILIGDKPLKASRLIKEGDEFYVKRTGLLCHYKILKLTNSRLSAKLVPEHCQDLTPVQDIEAYKARLVKMTIYRDPGTGRPTKKDRRMLDDFFNEE